MNRKVLVGLVALLALAMVASPLLSSASACTKVPASASLSGFLVFDPTTAKYAVSNGVLYLLYWQFSGTIAVTLDGGAPITWTWVDTCLGTYNVASNKGSYVFYEVWTNPSFGTMVGFDTPRSVGDFPIGVSSGTGIYTPVTHLAGHIVVVGTKGAWKGDVLDVSTSDLYLGIPFTGYLYTP